SRTHLLSYAHRGICRGCSRSGAALRSRCAYERHAGPQRLHSFPTRRSSDLWLLDSHVEEYGGAGESFDWSLVPAARDRPLILSRSEEHTTELQPRSDFVCRLLREKKKRMYNVLLIRNASTAQSFGMTIPARN